MEGTPQGPPYGPGPGDPTAPQPVPGQVPPGGYQQPPAGAYPPQGYAPQQGYGGPQQGQGQGQGPGFGERAGELAQAVGRHVRTPETKPFYKTSEFLVWTLAVISVLIAGAVIDGGDTDTLRAGTVWTLVIVISFGYVISRGISKAGTKYNDGSQQGRY
jgi:hypothetical protein